MTQNCTYTLDSVGCPLRQKRIDQQYLNRRFFATFMVLVLPKFFSTCLFTSRKIRIFIESKAGCMVFSTDNQKVNYIVCMNNEKSWPILFFYPIQFRVLKYLWAFRKHQNPDSGSTKTSIWICFVPFSLHILLGLSED